MDGDTAAASESAAAQLENDYKRRETMGEDELINLRDRLREAGKIQETFDVYDLLESRSKWLTSRSIEEIYCENYRCPPLTIDPHIYPSIEGHRLVAEYVDIPPRNSDSVWDHLDQIVIPTILEEGGGNQFYIPSQFDPQEFKLTYKNEITVQAYSRDMLIDAIKSLGYSLKQLDPTLEESFYGITPDIVVVCKDGKIVFVVEVKAPDANESIDEDKVMNSGKVGGQIWLYLMIMKQLGVAKPIGAICTLNRIRIVSLEEMNNDRFDNAMKSLKTSVARKQEMVAIPAVKRRKVSDLANRFQPNHAEKLLNVEDETRHDGVKVFKNAKLYGSPILGPEEVFPALLLSLKTAMLEIDPSVVDDYQQRDVVEVSPGDELGRRLYPWITTNGITFALTSENVAVDSCPPGRNTKNYHSISELGRGSDGQVYLVMSGIGKVAAAKFYHRKVSRAATPEEREMENKLADKECTRKRDLELQRWGELQGTWGAKAVTLIDRPCLLMPYGKDLDLDERLLCMDLIEGMLKSLAEAGYVYKDADLCWRHILKDGLSNDRKLFFADLLSLEKVQENVDTSQLIAQQLDELKRRVGNTGMESTDDDTTTRKRDSSEVSLTDLEESNAKVARTV